MSINTEILSKLLSALIPQIRPWPVCGCTRLSLVASSTFASAASRRQSGSWPESDVFISGRRQSELNATAEDIGENVTAVMAKLSDLDRPYDIVKRTTEHVDIVFANAALPTLASLREITEQHFDRIFRLDR